jgi:hypothetical protein
MRSRPGTGADLITPRGGNWGWPSFGVHQLVCASEQLVHGGGVGSARRYKTDARRTPVGATACLVEAPERLDEPLSQHCWVTLTFGDEH